MAPHAPLSRLPDDARMGQFFRRSRPARRDAALTVACVTGVRVCGRSKQHGILARQIFGFVGQVRFRISGDMRRRDEDHTGLGRLVTGAPKPGVDGRGLRMLNVL